LNPTSNVRTGVCPSFADHPSANTSIAACWSRSTPTIRPLRFDLANEFLFAHTEQGFTRDELRRLAANSIKPVFFPKPTKLCGWPELTLWSE